MVRFYPPPSHNSPAPDAALACIPLDCMLRRAGLRHPVSDRNTLPIVPHAKTRLQLNFLHVPMNIPIEKFTCRQCGNCCRIPGYVHLCKEEVKNIADYLKMDVITFTETFTTLAGNREGLVLKDHPDGSCILLDAQGKCRVHPVKPEQCRNFPFTWMNENSVTICPALQALTSAPHTFHSA